MADTNDKIKLFAVACCLPRLLYFRNNFENKSRLCNVLYIVVYPLVLFLLVIVLLQILITPLVSSNPSCYSRNSPCTHS